MSSNHTAPEAQRRTKVKELDRPERKLTKEEQQQVKGGVKAGWVSEVDGGHAATGGETEPQAVPHLLRIIE